MMVLRVTFSLTCLTSVTSSCMANGTSLSTKASTNGFPCQAKLLASEEKQEDIRQAMEAAKLDNLTTCMAVGRQLHQHSVHMLSTSQVYS